MKQIDAFDVITLNFCSKQFFLHVTVENVTIKTQKVSSPLTVKGEKKIEALNEITLNFCSKQFFLHVTVENVTSVIKTQETLDGSLT